MLLLIGRLGVIVIAWTILLVAGRHPLPFPDFRSWFFSASSPDGKTVFIKLLTLHGVEKRFQFQAGRVLPSIRWDGTSFKLPSAEVSNKLKFPGYSFTKAVVIYV